MTMLRLPGTGSAGAPTERAAMSDEGATQAVARFIKETTLASVPEPVRESARRTIADTVAVFLAGSGGDVVPHLREYLKRNPAPGSAPVIWRRTLVL